MMKNMKVMATELAEKNSHVRKAARDLMQHWEEISDCEEKISSDTAAYYDEELGQYGSGKFYLRSGRSEITHWNDALQEYSEVSETKHFTEIISMPALRTFLKNFGKMAGEIQTKMEKRSLNNDDLLDFMSKIIK